MSTMRFNGTLLVLVVLVFAAYAAEREKTCEQINTADECIAHDCFYCQLSHNDSRPFACLSTTSSCADRDICDTFSGTTVYGLRLWQVLFDYSWERGAFLRSLLLYNLAWICMICDERNFNTLLYKHWFFESLYIFSAGAVAAFFQFFARNDTKTDALCEGQGTHVSTLWTGHDYFGIGLSRLCLTVIVALILSVYTQRRLCWRIAITVLTTVLATHIVMWFWSIMDLLWFSVFNGNALLAAVVYCTGAAYSACQIVHDTALSQVLDLYSMHKRQQQHLAVTLVLWTFSAWLVIWMCYPDIGWGSAINIVDGTVNSLVAVITLVTVEAKLRTVSNVNNEQYECSDQKQLKPWRNIHLIVYLFVLWFNWLVHIVPIFTDNAASIIGSIVMWINLCQNIQTYQYYCTERNAAMDQRVSPIIELRSGCTNAWNSCSISALYALALCVVPLIVYISCSSLNGNSMNYEVFSFYSFTCSGAATFCAFQKAFLLGADGRLRPRQANEQDNDYNLPEPLDERDLEYT